MGLRRAITNMALLLCSAPAVAGSADDSTRCVQQWSLARHDNPWNGLTQNAAAEEATYLLDAVRTRPAGKNLAKQPVPLRAGDFILFRSGSMQKVVANARYFSNLQRIDVTGKPLRSAGAIGRATAAARKAWKPEEILGILLETQIIMTYIHMESSVCLHKVEDNSETYMAQLSGTHTYYTNARHTASFAFRFYLDKKSGAMRVENLAIQNGTP